MHHLSQSDIQQVSGGGMLETSLSLATVSSWAFIYGTYQSMKPCYDINLHFANTTLVAATSGAAAMGVVSALSNYGPMSSLVVTAMGTYFSGIMAHSGHLHGLVLAGC